MDRIKTDTRYEYKKLFDVEIDAENLCFETVGKDAAGNLILHRTQGGNIGKACFTSDEYYVIDSEEYTGLLDEARGNKLVSAWRLERLRRAGGVPGTRGSITDFEKVTLRLCGMRHITEYEIIVKDGSAEITEYGLSFSKDGDGRIPEKRTVCGKDRAMKLLNDCRLLSWDGFHGPHPKNVKDGTAFTLKASVNGGRQIYADGSQNFPKRFYEFRDGLYELLNGKTED